MNTQEEKTKKVLEIIDASRKQIIEIKKTRGGWITDITYP